ncbi:MAG: hypothetical protein QN174_01520 [Armatimonadota bacterium]|nr:hypothetical protein [Armatimonadota bacterium]MDR7455061.1 hypothetical protein [Armatimonadota bacterium]MDR7456895.1 hypothetical protein [Armatimonadota bacterium]MDR7495626.1 hypothetical protein [Armatimonadota bacterium]
MVTARFLVDRPIRQGMVRAILDTLTAQGGYYEPHLIRRSADDGDRRIFWGRPAGLLDDVAQGPDATFLRVAEGLAEPVLTFRISPSPRALPSVVTLRLPAEALASTRDVEQLLGVGKGLYLFLESPWGTIGAASAADGAPRTLLQWATYVGPETVSRAGPARFLTSLAFIVEILPDGGVMLVTHASPSLAETDDGRALRRHLEDATGLADALGGLARHAPPDGDVPRTAGITRRSQGPSSQV